MTTVEVEDSIAAPLEKVWALVSDFTGFVEAQGMTCKSQGEGIGMTRTIELGGASITERLEELDDGTHTTSYSIVESPLPVTGYQAWIAASEASDGTTQIRWWSTFEPAGGDEAAVSDMISGIYSSGIAGIKKALGA
ncbi:MAG TPA: SRPBCC family protein [Acidimicrobiales bacterium]|nr:SRPBCC family protein [Acidimicrobiales bacterium]